jgi:magnesium transporter
VAWTTQDGWAWGLVLFLALVGNMAVAGAFGALVPLTLRYFRLDPALASGIFLTMITDAMGFLLLLGLATLLIDELT